MIAVETYVAKDGTRWERVWRRIGEGIEQLVWRVVPPADPGT